MEKNRRLKSPLIAIVALAVVATGLLIQQPARATVTESVSDGELSVAAGPDWPVLRGGMRGPNVSTMQLLLRQRGYDLDGGGTFGPKTKEMVTRFKRSVGLPADGVMGPNAWRELVFRLVQGQSGAKVRAAKVQLNKHGYGLNASKNNFSSTMGQAVERFKSSNGLRSDRVVGTTTWRYLLGKSGGKAHRLPIPKSSTTRDDLGGYHWGGHVAADIIVSYVPAYAAMSGTVQYYSSSSCGIGIRLMVGTYNRFVYCHLSGRSVADGQRVTAGQRVGTTGDTGNSGAPHLHVEIRTGSSGTARCPQPWLVAVYDGRTPPRLGNLPTSGCGW